MAPGPTRGFSTMMQALSSLREKKLERTSPVSQGEPHAEPSEQPARTTKTSRPHRSRQPEGRRDSASRGYAADKERSIAADSSSAMPHETSRGTDTILRAEQHEQEDESAATTSDEQRETLMRTLLGDTMTVPAAMTVPAPELTGTDAPVSQETTQVTEGGTAAENGTHMDIVTATAEGHPDADILMKTQLLVEKTTSLLTTFESSDSSQSDIPEQGQKTDGLSFQQGDRPRASQDEQGALVVPAWGLARDQEMIRMQKEGSVPVQSSTQNGDGLMPLPDTTLPGPDQGTGELSLHQQNSPAASGDDPAAGALSGYKQGDGQSYNSETEGQRKEESRKWFSPVDRQSVEIAARASQHTGPDLHDAGGQYPQNQQGQGSAVLSSQVPPVSAQSSPLQPQRVSLGPEPAPVPFSQSVQFDLSPADFGQLRVRVVLSDQTIHTHMSTDRAELGQMLTSRQEQLSTQLAGAGLDLGRFQVQVDGERTRHAGQEWTSQSQSHGGFSQQQREGGPQGRQQDIPVSVLRRTGNLSVFA